MTKLAQTLGLTEFQTEIIATVRQFVEKEVIPNAPALERADTYPQDIVDQMRDMGLFGLMIPQEYGGVGGAPLTFPPGVEERGRGRDDGPAVAHTPPRPPCLRRHHGAPEHNFDGYRASADDILGGTPGQGFFQMMDGIEVGRVNVSARACGVGIRAFELAVRYAQQRHTFGKPIAEHQAIAFQLAEMATKVEAAHLMMVNAARLKDSGERNDVAAAHGPKLARAKSFVGTQHSSPSHRGRPFLHPTRS